MLHTPTFVRVEATMKIIGIIKRVDKLGRIVLPKEIRDFYKIGENDPVEILSTDMGILIKKVETDIIRQK